MPLCTPAQNLMKSPCSSVPKTFQSKVVTWIGFLRDAREEHNLCGRLHHGSTARHQQSPVSEPSWISRRTTCRENYNLTADHLNKKYDPTDAISAILFRNVHLILLFMPYVLLHSMATVLCVSIVPKNHQVEVIICC